MYNASERKDVRAAEKEAKAASRDDAEIIVQIMAERNGRAWMFRHLTRCHVFANPFTLDDRTTSFACGEMNIGQQLMADIMAVCPDQFILMQRESNDRSTASEQRRSKNGDGRTEGPEPDDGDAEEARAN